MKIAFYIPILLAVQTCNNIDHSKLAGKMEDEQKTRIHTLIADTGKLPKSNEEWRKILSPEVYEVAREKGTERPFTGIYNDHKEIGTYYCAACGNPLFASNGKFESSCGWPSFFEPISKGSIIYTPDNSHGMSRTEVQCGKCKSHLGHVFEDGPPPTGLRYCINSVILGFEAAEKARQSSKQ